MKKSAKLITWFHSLQTHCSHGVIIPEKNSSHTKVECLLMEVVVHTLNYLEGDCLMVLLIPDFV